MHSQLSRFCVSFRSRARLLPLLLCAAAGLCGAAPLPAADTPQLATGAVSSAADTARRSAGGSPSAAGGQHEVFINFDYEDLERIRERIRGGQSKSRHAYASLLRQAESFMRAEPESVMDKKYTPPSGDKHDYFDIGNYSWPNPNTEDGLPYIRRDGYNNPEAGGPEYDKQRYIQMRVRVNALVLAWFFTGEEKYAQRAAEFLRVWFLDPQTRMNPNFNYSASLPGVYDGAAIGIIQGVELIRLVDSLKLLRMSPSWTAQDEAGMRQWFRDYTTWLLESDLGRQEAAARNNHGTWYAAQVAAYALYTGDEQHVRKMAELGRAFIDDQVAPDGSLPQEMRRNRSKNYAVYGLRAFAALARATDAVNEDLWHYKTPDGRGLELAFAFIAPYILEEKEWPRPSLDKDFNFLTLEVIRLAAKAYQSPELRKATNRLTESAKQSDRFAWLYGLPFDSEATEGN